MPEALILKGVSKSFGDVQAVQDLDLSVEAGSVFGLLGPNGAGKTTTIRMIMDIIKPDTGVISLLGETDPDRRRDRIGYLPGGARPLPQDEGPGAAPLLRAPPRHGAATRRATRADQLAGALRARRPGPRPRWRRSPRGCSRRCRSSPPSCTSRRWSSWTSRSPASIRSTSTWSRTILLELRNRARPSSSPPTRWRWWRSCATPSA